ncbi:MAG: amino acid ABC transporter substrate-binding protein [Clostridia bacterium]|nr:amino acid ABC transporter substrate-binding protein [Clostridia bacterium]
MKKLLSLVLALVMVFSICALAGCGKKDDNKLVMATNAAFPPYEYYEGDKIIGIDAEIAAKIADKLGMELEIKDIEFDSIVSGVASGKYDFGMAGMTVTEDRLKNVNFSTSYAKGVQAVIVPENSEYASYEDFYTGFDEEGNPVAVKDGIKIGVQMGTTGDIYSSSDPAEWGFGKDKVAQYNTGADAVQALVTGKVTAVIIDNEPAKAYVAANAGLKILEGAYVEEDYAICFSKKNTDLRDKVDKALSELIADGTVKKIIDKYIKAD